MRQKRGAGVRLRQQLCWDGRDLDRRAAAAGGAAIAMANMPLDPDQRAPITIAFAHLLTESLEGGAVVRASRLMLRDIVRNVFARKLFRDGLAAAGMRALVRGDRRRSVRLRRIRGLDRGEHLGLVEQHLLISARVGRVVLGGAAKDLRLPPAQFLLQP